MSIKDEKKKTCVCSLFWNLFNSYGRLKIWESLNANARMGQNEKSKTSIQGKIEKNEI